jgi:hypothetical protein
VKVKYKNGISLRVIRSSYMILYFSIVPLELLELYWYSTQTGFYHHENKIDRSRGVNFDL